MKLLRKITRPLQRYGARLFIRNLANMLKKFDKKLKAADYSRHERRRLKRTILDNIDIAVKTFLKD